VYIRIFYWNSWFWIESVWWPKSIYTLITIIIKIIKKKIHKTVIFFSFDMRDEYYSFFFFCPRVIVSQHFRIRDFSKNPNVHNISKQKGIIISYPCCPFINCSCILFMNCSWTGVHKSHTPLLGFIRYILQWLYIKKTKYYMSTRIS